MFDTEQIQAIAAQHQNELELYRLEGDLNYLTNFINDLISASQCKPSYEEFYQELTSNEQVALAAIQEAIGAEGNISIVKMQQATNLSRPVFTSLLVKMEKYQIAEIKNQGVKGTHIKFQERNI